MEKVQDIVDRFRASETRSYLLDPSIFSTLCGARCYLPKSSKEQLGMISPIDNYEFPSSLLAAYTVCQAQNRNVVVRVMNTSNINVELQAGQKICEFCPLVKTYSPDLFHTSEHQVNINFGTLSSNKLASQLAFQFDPSISDQAKESLLQTL